MEIENIEEISKQILYRPVLQEDVPDLPEYFDRSIEAKEAREWWREQYKRCTEGWLAPDGHYLNPITYFGLNFCKVEVEHSTQAGSSYSRPDYRDNDEELLSIIWNGRARIIGKDKNSIKLNARGIVGAKGRRIGWTTQFLEIYFLWRLIFMPEYSIGRLYPDDENMADERRQLERAFNHLHKAFKMRQTDDGLRELEWIETNKNRLSLGYYNSTDKKKGEGVLFKNAICYFDIATMNNRYGPFRGKKLGVVEIVEAGKWTRMDKAIAAANDCLRSGRHYFGHYIIGGTSDAINIEATDYKDAYYNPKPYRCVSHFSSAALYRFFDPHTGKSDIERGEEFVKNERAALIASGKNDLANTHRQENPLNPEEAFIPRAETVYPDHKINEQLEYIYQNDVKKTKILRGNLEWVLGPDRKPILPRQVKFVPDKLAGQTNISDRDFDAMKERSHFQMLSGFEPQPELRQFYVSAIDDVFKEGIPDPKNSTSKNAFVVWLKDTYRVETSGLPVFIYNHRHSSTKRTYEDFLKIMVFFGHKNVLYEYHPGQNDFINYLRKMGKMDAASGAGSRNQYTDMLVRTRDQWGIGSVQEAMINEMTISGEEWFDEDNHLKVYFEEVLMGFKNWRKKNDDVASATHLIFAYLDRLKTKQAIENREQSTTQTGFVDFRFGEKSQERSSTGNGWSSFRFG